MLKINKKSLKNKEDPQKFLQYEIGENKFKMILLNKPYPPLSPNLPSGFKPLCSSTPKRSQSSFEIIDEPVTKLTSHLKMSEFIGEIPYPSERNCNTRSPNKKNQNFVGSTSESFQTPTISTDQTPVQHVKHQRSTSCESWDSFQNHLRKILNTSVKDLNTTEKILKLICQFNSNAKKKKKIQHHHDRNPQIFENYVKIKALRKASETIQDWHLYKEIFVNNVQSKEEGFNTKSQFVLSTKNVASFKDGKVKRKSKPEPTLKDLDVSMENDITAATTVNRKTEPNFEKIFDKNDQPIFTSKNSASCKVREVPILSTLDAVKPSSNDFEIIIANDLTKRTVNWTTPLSSSCPNTTEDILELRSSSKNTNRKKHQLDEVLNFSENVIDIQDSIMISKTSDDLSILNEIFPDYIESEERFDKNNQLMMSRESDATFEVLETSHFSAQTKSKKIRLKIERIQNQKMATFPYFSFNETFEKKQISDRHRRRFHDPNPKNSQFEEDLRKFIKTTNGGGVKQNKILKNLELIVPNDTRAISTNRKPQLRTSLSGWISQFHSSYEY